ncbi:hypothetical protein P9112_000449 [Eukaryota sp. TZLM1-RC]
MEHPPPPAPSQIDTHYDLDVSHEKRSFWLVGLPSSIVHAWNDVQDSNTQVGTLRVIHRSGKPPEYQIVSHIDVPNLPSEYTFNRQHQASQLRVFSKDNIAKKAAIEGSITDRYRCLPIKNKTIIKKISEHRRVVQQHRPRSRVYDSRANIVPMGGLGMVREHRIAVGGEKRTEKRIRAERDVVKNLLFQLFNRKDFWSLSELVDETDQPQAWLRDVLDDICIRIISGPNKDLYELKPEYKYIE